MAITLGAKMKVCPACHAVFWTAAALAEHVKKAHASLVTAPTTPKPSATKAGTSAAILAALPLVATTTAVISEAAGAVTAAIPQAFLAAFGEGGAVAASGLSVAASVLAPVAAVGALGYAGYQLWNYIKGLSAADKQHADNVKLIELSNEVLAGGTLTAAELSWLKATFPTVTPSFTGTSSGVNITATGVAVMPAAVTEPSVIVRPAATTPPVTITKGAEVAKPGQMVVQSPDVYVTVEPSPAPTVIVNEAQVPQPLDVIGPMTAAQLAGIAPLIATAFATKQKETTQGCFESTGQLLLGNILKTLVPAGIAAGFMFNPTLQNAMSSVVTKFVEAIYSPLTKQAPITPEKGPGIGAVLLGQAVIFGSGAHMMAIMAEASAPLKQMGLGYLAAFLADAAGFSRIAAAYQGMMIQVGLSQPMKYWAQERFRPEIPSEGYLLRLLANYAITPDEFKRNMAYHGFPDQWIDKLPDIAFKAFSPMLFRSLGEAGLLDEAFIDDELRHAEYRPESLPYLKQWLAKLSAGELKGQFASAVTGAYNKGLLETDELKDHLGNLGYSEAQAGKAAYAVELSFATNIAEEMRATYLQQHKQGQINDGELGLQLSTLGYRPEKVQADVVKARAWFKPKPAGKVDPAIEKVYREAQAKYVQGYIALYRGEYLDDDGLYNALVQIGVDPGVAQGTVFLESARTLPKLTE